MLPALHTCLLYTHINARKIENCITKRCIQLLRLKDKIIMQVITKIKIKKNFVNLHGRNKCDIMIPYVKICLMKKEYIKLVHRSYE